MLSNKREAGSGKREVPLRWICVHRGFCRCTPQCGKLLTGGAQRARCVKFLSKLSDAAEHTVVFASRQFRRFYFYFLVVFRGESSRKRHFTSRFPLPASRFPLSTALF